MPPVLAMQEGGDDSRPCSSIVFVHLEEPQNQKGVGSNGYKTKFAGLRNNGSSSLGRVGGIHKQVGGDWANVVCPKLGAHDPNVYLGACGHMDMGKGFGLVFYIGGVTPGGAIVLLAVASTLAWARSDREGRRKGLAFQVTIDDDVFVSANKREMNLLTSRLRIASSSGDHGPLTRALVAAAAAAMPPSPSGPTRAAFMQPSAMVAEAVAVSGSVKPLCFSRHRLVTGSTHQGLILGYPYE
ncbi:hypothetical protein Ancab_005631 [Ancistrocladus abbreviatus]